MKNFIFKILIKILSRLKKTHSRDFLDKIEYLILVANGKHRGGYDLKDEVMQIKEVFKNEKINNIIDCGANEGKYTDFLMKYFPNSNYFLFEPNKVLFHSLMNKFENKKNIKIFDFGLSDENATVKFYETDYHGLSSLYERKHEIREKKFLNFKSNNLVKVKTFESLNLYQNIDILKIDVEGAELKVLNGFKDKILNVKVIQFEFGRSSLDSKSSFLDFYKFFEDKNFDIFRMTPSGLKKISNYSYFNEMFIAMNFLAINKRKLN